MPTYNSGSYNAGSYSSGSSGNYNLGFYNSGSYNAGSSSGNYNLGFYNSGTYSGYSGTIVDHREFRCINKDLYVDQGDSFLSRITLNYPNGMPVNLNGYTVLGSVKRFYKTKKVIDLYCSVINASAGSISIEIDELDTTKLIYDRYVYEVKISDGINIIKVLSGQILVSLY